MRAAEDGSAISGGAVIRLFAAGESAIKDDVRAVVVAPGGDLVVGSNQLAIFDGHAWQRIETPNTYAFRALAAAPSGSGRVWVGAIDHIGYLERHAARAWSYVPIRTGALQPHGALGDVWSVHAISEPDPDAGGTRRHGAVWITNQHALRWDGERLDVLHLPSTTRLAGFSGGDDALVYQAGRGLLRIGIQGQPELLLPEAQLPGGAVSWILPLPAEDVRERPLLIGSRDAAYRRNSDSQLTRLDALSEILRDKIVTSAVELDSARIAFGTFDAGIVIATRDGIPLAMLSTPQGLADASVYALAAVDGRLFAGLPGGLARIEGAADARVFSRDTHLAHGTPREVIEHGGATFVLTANGLYRRTAADSNVSPITLHRVLQHPSPLWDIASAAGQLWLGGFGGAWRITDAGAPHELHIATDVLQLAPSARLPQGVILTEGYQLKSLTPSPHGGWAARGLHASVPDTPVSLLEDPLGNVWVSTIKDGIARFRWRDTLDSSPPMLELQTFHRPGATLPAATTRPVLALLDGALHAFSEEGALRLEPDGRFHPVPGLEGFAVVSAVELGSGETLWLGRVRELAAFGTHAVLRSRNLANGSFAFESVTVPGLDAIGAVTRINRTIESSEPILWISGGRGMLRIAQSALASAPSPPQAALAVYDDGRSAVSRPGEELRFGAATRSLAFHFSTLTAVSGERVFFQTRLQGSEATWSAPTPAPQREFSRLAPGGYTFDVRVLDRFGRAGPVASETFVIIARWWRHPAAYAGYGVLLALAIAGGARWRIVRLKRQNERLNRLVSERTRELELSNTAKSEFLENISHEIRNPLNGLSGLLNLMKEDKLAPRERELARSLKSVAGTLTRVFEDVLEFSKLEYGYAKLNPAPFSLRGALEDLAGLFAAVAQQQGCVIRIEWPPHLADGFVGDEPRIKTVVGNFIGNALKYAPRAPIDIRVSATEESNGLVDLYIDVTDHGPGIPPEEQGLIFKKFVRGSDAKRKEIAGTGLGLATCHVLARLMNGHVGVESTPGKGAMFFLRVLLPQAELSATTPSAAPNSAAGGERALIVDDEAYNRTVLEGLALELGFAADIAGNAAEAAHHLRARDYSVVFIDWELPGPKGGEVAKLIRGRPGGDRPIILATTAHESEEMQDRCRASGMDGFLRKPFDADIIRRGIAAARERRDAAARPGLTPTRAMVNGPHPPLDLGAFAHYARARPDDPAGAKRNYLTTLDSQVAALTAALRARRTNEIADIAHRLRALAGLIGAAELNVNAKRLEEFARADDTTRSESQGIAVLHACVLLKERLGAQVSVSATSR